MDSLDRPDTMLSKPSRSEIEQALSGDNAHDKRQTQSSQFEMRNSQRQQQVIGGDLQGISERQKYGAWRRTLNYLDQASVINWLVGLALLIILMVMIWPQKPSPIKSDLENTISEQERAIYTESRLDDETDSFQDNSFSRDNDLDRASLFRVQDALEKKIRGLLAEAEKLITDGWYTLPLENNALQKYQQILQLDTLNVSALQGLDYISGRFLKTGTEALKNNNNIDALVALDKLKNIDAESEQYYQLTDEIERWKQQQQIYSLVQQAQTKFIADELIQPARDNAFYYFQQALSLDGKNKTALDGVDAITSQFVEKTQNAIFNDQLIEAQSHIETIQIIAPDNKNIKSLQKLISDAVQASETQTSQTDEILAIEAPQVPDTISTDAETPPQEDTVLLELDNQNTQTSAPESISTTRTPSKEASEQQAFDKLYLSRGLKAHDDGEFESALALLKPLADKGISRAQIRIANMVFSGNGVLRDKQSASLLAEDALPSIQKFAEEGRTWAQTELANSYQIGLGQTRSTQSALKWYLAAANQGYPKAQARLGLIYLRGDGVLPNRRVATLWLQRAAKQGDRSAIVGLKQIGIRP